jgi:excisionase family DNA binding protein
MPDQSPWLTVTEASARAKCSPKTIYRAVASGKLKAARISAGRSLRFHVLWIDAWLETMATEAEIVNAGAGPAVPFRRA